MGQTPTKDSSPVSMATEDYFNIRQKKKVGHMSNAEEYSIPSKELKQILKNVLKGYADENLLQNYAPRLKKCINETNPLRLTKFFVDSLAIASGQNELFESKIYQASPCKILVPVLKASQHSKTVQQIPQIPESQAQQKSQSEKAAVQDLSSISSISNDSGKNKPAENLPKSPRKKPAPSLCTALCKFFELEIMKRENIFYEISEAFGKLFAAQYDEGVKNFGTAKRVLSDGKIPFDYVISPKVKERVKATFEKARIDLKRYQNLQFDLIKAFLTEVSKWSGNDETLVPVNKVIEQINIKLLFSKTECYHTYFTLIRYSTLIEETKLKHSISKLRNLKPADFGIDPNFCLEKKENPYQHVIDSYNYLDTFANPFDKFNVIAKMRGQILKEIDRYWSESYNQGLITKKLNVTADQLLPLHCFCLVASVNEKMRAHQAFVEEFVDEDSLKFGEQSYYFTTFKVAVDFLVNISADPVKGISTINKPKEKAKEKEKEKEKDAEPAKDQEQEKEQPEKHAE